MYSTNIVTSYDVIARSLAKPVAHGVLPSLTLKTRTQVIKILRDIVELRWYLPDEADRLE